jgi:hypothetical protein
VSGHEFTRADTPFISSLSRLSADGTDDVFTSLFSRLPNFKEQLRRGCPRFRGFRNLGTKHQRVDTKPNLLAYR